MLIDRTQVNQDWRKEIPALQLFSDAVDTVFRPDDGASLFECRAALERLLASDWFERLVSSELEALARFPQGPTGGFSETRMTLFGGKGMALTMMLVAAGATSPDRLLAACRHTLLGVAGPGALEVRRFFQPDPFPSDVVDRTRRLEDRGSERLAAGQTFTIRTGHDVVVSFAPAGPTVVLALEAEESTPYYWRYDPRTLLPAAVVCGTNDGSRLQFAANVLARLGDGRCAPALRALAGHSDHVLRWTAIRTLVQLDRRAGRELLEAALEDPHPHIRQATRTALERLSSPPTS
jgi:hypothetical protein